MSLALFSDAETTGMQTPIQYESRSANTTAFAEGFFEDLREQMDRFKMDGEAYGLPVRLEISMESKGAGVVRGVKLGPRRFPVVRIREMAFVTVHRQSLAQMLEVGGGRISLPVAPAQLAAAPDQIAEGDADLEPDPEPPMKPRLVAAPDVIDVEEAQDPTLGDQVGIYVKELLGLQKASARLSARVKESLREADILPSGIAWHELTDDHATWGEVKAVLDDRFGVPAALVESYFDQKGQQMNIRAINKALRAAGLIAPQQGWRDLWDVPPEAIANALRDAGL